MSSQFDYSHLEEDPDPVPSADSDNAGWTATFPDTQVSNSLTDSSVVKPPQGGSSCRESSSSSNPQHPSPKYDPNQSARTNSSDQGNVKYTPLQFTSVQELGAYSEDYDPDLAPDDDRIVYDSCVKINLDSTRKSAWTKFHYLICGLLVAAVAVVSFGLLYVFVILPAQKGKVVFTDGKMHTEDLARLKKLGKTVMVTTCGLVRGTAENGGYAFKGIPYARAPVGDLRWAPPVPLSYDSHTCWHDVRNATSFGSQCVQPQFDNVDEVEGSEDCLFLNVWTPSMDPINNFPVMVWLHSGDMVYGSGHMPGMSPTAQLAYETKFVYVSFNYRLGAFGFLAVDPLRTGSSRSAGNYGIMDQQMALQWVHQNIRHFGGNENLVTVFGHGSGATSIQGLMSSPASTGLFHKAWLTSPVAVFNKTLSEACRDNQEFLAKSGCSNVSCMRSLTPTEVSRASPWKLSPHWSLDDLINEQGTQLRNELAIYDGHIVNWSSSKEGLYGVDVPVVFGTSYFDVSSLLHEGDLFNMTWNNYNILIIHQVDVHGMEASFQAKSLYSNLPRLQESIHPSHFPFSASAHLARMIGDVKNVCPMKTLADAFAFQHPSPVYFYVAELYPSHNMRVSTTSTTNFIGWDVLAFFDGFRDVGFLAQQSDFNFQSIVREEVMTFVRDGKPDAVRWKTVDQGVGVISNGVTVRPAEANFFSKCTFWKNLGYFRFSWMG